MADLHMSHDHGEMDFTFNTTEMPALTDDSRRRLSEDLLMVLVDHGISNASVTVNYTAP